jgi:hypothetical protein
MGHFSMETYAPTGSNLSGNQQLRPGLVTESEDPVSHFVLQKWLRTLFAMKAIVC